MDFLCGIQDTGVHATANVCHVDVVRYSKRKPGDVMPPHEPETVKKAVNHFLQVHFLPILNIDLVF
jgi:tRNA pseudouridine38-40 synthase